VVRRPHQILVIHWPALMAKCGQGNGTTT